MMHAKPFLYEEADRAESNGTNDYALETCHFCARTEDLGAEIGVRSLTR
jgi:hypothetical protein